MGKQPPPSLARLLFPLPDRCCGFLPPTFLLLAGVWWGAPGLPARTRPPPRNWPFPCGWPGPHCSEKRHHGAGQSSAAGPDHLGQVSRVLWGKSANSPCFDAHMLTSSPGLLRLEGDTWKSPETLSSPLPCPWRCAKPVCPHRGSKNLRFTNEETEADGLGFKPGTGLQNPHCQPLCCKSPWPRASVKVNTHTSVPPGHPGGRPGRESFVR